jgi:hypothetical protein
MSHFKWPITQTNKQIKHTHTHTHTLQAPQMKSLYAKIWCFPFGPPIYTSEKGRTLGKQCEAKSVVLLGTTIGNTLGTMWEHDKNMVKQPPKN